jgi:hypothetical protein
MSRKMDVAGLLLLIGFCQALTSTAYAQKNGELTDLVTVTVAESGASTGFATSATSPTGVAFGSLNSPNTLDDYTYTSLHDITRSPKEGGGYGFTTLCFKGFASNPGQSWLVQATASGHTYTSPLNYGWEPSDGTACWNIQGAGPAFEGHTTVAMTITHLSNAGWIAPKWQVVGITYAPPGSKSTATYTSGFLSGTATKNTATFKTTESVSDKITGGFDLFGLFVGNTTSTIAANWSQQQSSSTSISVANQYATGLIVPGPAPGTDGVDHDYDTVYVWVNAAVQLAFNGNIVGFGGYNWDARDPITGMDVVPLTVGELRGTQTIPADVRARLNRTWDSSLGALTSVDLLAIAETDPFYANPSYNPNSDPHHRFDLPNGLDLIINYVPEPAGGQPTGETYTSQYSTTSEAGQTATQTFTTSYAFEGTASAAFILALGGSVTVSGQYTSTNEFSGTISSGTVQSANFTIYPPLSTDNYTGPTAIQVWKDNIYGTFMFYPEN